MHFKDDNKIRAVEINGVRQPDPALLQRPFTMPRSLRRKVFWVVLVAIVIAVICVTSYVVNYAMHDARQSESVQRVINGTQAQDVPQLSTFLGMNADQIRQYLSSSRISTIDLSSISGDSEEALDVIKIPSDISATDAVSIYQNGIDSLSGEDAARYLVNSWQLTLDSGDSVDLHLHFADFADQNPQQAVQSTVNQQGFANSSLGDSGTDASGNNYQNGSITTSDGQTYNWTVSSCPLTNVYSNDGLPANSCYVGVRIYQ